MLARSPRGSWLNHRNHRFVLASVVQFQTKERFTRSKVNPLQATIREDVWIQSLYLLHIKSHSIRLFAYTHDQCPAAHLAHLNESWSSCFWIWPSRLSETYFFAKGLEGTHLFEKSIGMKPELGTESLSLNFECQFDTIHSCNIAVCYTKSPQRQKSIRYRYIYIDICAMINNTFFFGCQRIAYCKHAWKTTIFCAPFHHVGDEGLEASWFGCFEAR